ncbi:MAG: hypothetical protein GY705_31365, partial [Bacteroidetes bacterium]|nr:hypothetical protein [Bacteroidota bacterium]
RNKLIGLEDLDGLLEQALLAFRELVSNGSLTSSTSVKMENGHIEGMAKTVWGPIASICCTTRAETYEDNESRTFIIAVDETRAQTQKIIDYQNQKAAGQISRLTEEKAIRELQNFVEVLKPYEVLNPYATKIKLPAEAHKIRRLNDLYQGFIKMITIVHQYQREKTRDGKLITTKEDIKMANAIMFESILLKVDELDGSLRHFYEQIKNLIEDREQE